jgi:hypothetical protein
MTNTMTNTLFFGSGSNNAKLRKLEQKLGRKVFTFSLPAGYTCPGADKCASRFDRKLGKIVDGENQEFRCFAASMESVFSGFREHNDQNFALLRACESQQQMTDLILASLPAKAQIVRVHVSGDFYSEGYFRAWLQAALQRPDVQFYAYTKSLNFLVNNLDEVPSNFSITASHGGRFDHLINQHSLKSAKVVLSLAEASVLGIEVDHDDSHAVAGENSFALLIHGQQHKGSQAAEALKAL